jgi:hypothetical protein
LDLAGLKVVDLRFENLRLKFTTPIRDLEFDKIKIVNCRIEGLEMLRGCGRKLTLRNNVEVTEWSSLDLVEPGTYGTVEIWVPQCLPGSVKDPKSHFYVIKKE